jgi:hypothetical protein
MTEQGVVLIIVDGQFTKGDLLSVRAVDFQWSPLIE